jgi:glycosyltransferase involved in cell wall biosynthesis
MHVLAINQFYAPDHAATAQLLSELCEDLVAGGDEVTVIASRGSYLGGKRWPPRESIHGVTVVRPPSSSLGKTTIAHRLGDYLSFWASSVAAALAVKKPDVILALTTPPMIAAGAALAASGRRVPLVTWVQDVYPEVADAFGVLRARSAPYRALQVLTRRTHLASAKVVVLSEGMRQRVLQQGARSEQLEVIPNWADGRAIAPVLAEKNPFRMEHGVTDRFVAMYSGNLGAGHEFETFLGAARRLKDLRPEVLFLFVGDGARRNEAMAASSDLPNVRFLPYQPRERLAESLGAADVHLISLQAGLEGLLVPSKLYGALASGRPVFYVGPETCEVSLALRAHGCGSVWRAGGVEELARGLVRLCDDRAECARLGQRARLAFEKNYDRPLATARWRQVLRSAGDVSSA